MSEDLVVADHRKVSFQELDKQGAIDRTVAGSEFSLGGPSVKDFSFLVATERGAVVRLMIEPSADSFDFVRLGVILVAEGLVTRYEYFEPEAIDLALARFEELTTGLEAADDATRIERATRRLNRALGDWDRVAELLHPNFAMESSRGIGAGGGASRDGFVESSKHLHSLFEGAAAVSILATRGSGIGLAASDFGAAEDFHLRIFTAIEVDESGLFLRMHNFDEDRLDDALAVSDEWFKESLPSELGVAVDSMTLSVAVGRGEDVVEQFAATFSEDLLVMDHRGISFPETDKAGQIERIKAMRELAPNDVRLQHCRIHAGTDRGAVAKHSDGVVGRRCRGEFPRLCMLLVADGVVARLEYFEPDALDAALARFEELTSPQKDL